MKKSQLVLASKILSYYRSPKVHYQRYLSLQRKEGWESVIGLEVHAQIKSESKLFSPAYVDYGVPVNTQVSLFDCAIPGTLPILNKKCVEAGVLTALALSCRINEVSAFDRKHYFYADSPAGFQITQQRKPIANDGYLEFIVHTPEINRSPYYCRSKIRQLQLEQDSGKSLHDEAGQRSLIDLNRAGMPLMEIVFDPDLKNGEEAGALVKELILILQNLGTCDCKMEEGSLRIDANISVNRIGEKIGTRTEVKNLGSIRSLVNSIEFEVERQILLLENSGVVTNETRSYDAESKETRPMRDKEVKQDYRFMPEPNLPPLVLFYDPHSEINPATNSVNIAHIQRGLKEMPDVVRRRLVQIYNMRLETAIVIVSTPGFINYFNEVMKLKQIQYGVRVANILQIQFMQYLNDLKINFDQSPVTPETFSLLFDMLISDQVNLEKMEATLGLLFSGDTRFPKQIIQDEGWTKISDEGKIIEVCKKVIQENPKVAKSFENSRNAKHKMKLMGLLRKETGGNYDMKKVSETLESMFPAKQS